MIIYNGAIVTIHNDACTLFTEFRYDPEWLICTGILRGIAFLGMLSNDARVIVWNNGNTWIRQEARILPRDTPTDYAAPPVAGTVTSSLLSEEQQQSAATYITRNTKIAIDLLTSPEWALMEPQQQPHAEFKNTSNKRMRNDNMTHRPDLIPELTQEHKTALHFADIGIQNLLN